MNVRDLIPWGRDNSPAPTAYRNDQASPFLALHREMNRLFDEAFRDFGAPSLFGRMPTWPSVEITDAEKEVRVSAELPGLDEKDVEVLVEGDVLTLRGEKKAERSGEGRFFTERYYGAFERQIPLEGVEEDKAEASFKNGVLTVSLPKSEKAREGVKRIAINAH